MPLPYSASDDIVLEFVAQVRRDATPIDELIAKAMNEAFALASRSISGIMGQHRGHEPLADAIQRLVRDHNRALGELETVKRQSVEHMQALARLATSHADGFLHTGDPTNAGEANELEEAILAMLSRAGILAHPGDGVGMVAKVIRQDRLRLRKALESMGVLPPPGPEDGREPRTAMWIRCDECEHRSFGLLLPMHAGPAGRVLSNLHCPSCGADVAVLRQVKDAAAG